MVRCLSETVLTMTFVLTYFVTLSTDFILQGTTRNMASLALAGLVTDFFYAGPSALGKLFPEVFAQEVPKPVVCLAATAVSICSC